MFFVNNYQKYFLFNAFLSIHLAPGPLDLPDQFLFNWVALDLFVNAWPSAPPISRAATQISTYTNVHQQDALSFPKPAAVRRLPRPFFQNWLPLFGSGSLNLCSFPMFSFLQFLLKMCDLSFNKFPLPHPTCSTLSFHVIPLAGHRSPSPFGTFPLLLSLIICFLNAIFYVAPFDLCHLVAMSISFFCLCFCISYLFSFLMVYVIPVFLIAIFPNFLLV